MNERIRALREKANGLIQEAEGIRERYKASAEPMSQEDLNRLNALYDEADTLADQIKAEERGARFDALVREPVAAAVHPATDAGVVAAPDKPDFEKAMGAFRGFLRYGEKGITVEGRQLLKAYQADSDVEGGYITAPEQWVNSLIQALDNDVIIRGLARKFSVPKAESLGAPSLDTDLGDAEWTSELDTGSEDTALRLGKRDLHPHPMAKMVKLSRTLIRKSIINPEELLMERLRYVFGVTEEKGFMTGTGDQQPLGIFTASSLGIPTSRDIVTGSATDVTADGWINFVHSLKAGYRRNARIVLHRDVLRNTRKLKDADGNYIWVSGLQQMLAPTILGIGYVESEYAPNTFTNGNYAAVIGDFSNYWIADSLDMNVQTLIELYARANQIGYIARREVDGMPVLAEAFSRLKFAAS